MHNMADPSKDNSTRLHIAVTNNCVTTVRDLLEHGADVNARNTDDSTALHIAVTNDCVTIVRVLLEYGTNVNARNKDDSTALHIAVTNDCVTIVRVLLEYGANVNARNKDNLTPLLLALKIRFPSRSYPGEFMLEVIKVCLEHGADVNARNTDDSTALHIAVTYECVTTVRDLLKHGAYVNARNKDDSTALHIAVTNDCVTIVRVLREYGANVNARNKDNLTPLLLALKIRFPSRSYPGEFMLKVIKVCLEHGADVNARNTDDSTALHIAVKYECVTTVRDLLKHGAHVNARNKDNLTPLLLALQTRFKYGSPNTNFMIEVITVLLKRGADVNVKDMDNQTPLYLAVEADDLLSFEPILEKKPDPSDKYNRLALYSALRQERKEHSEKMVEDMVNYGFSINAQDVVDSSLLNFAVEKGNVKIVEDLLKYGADVNYSRSGVWEKNSPLHIAAGKNYGSIVKLLINYGANINARNEADSTPLHLAIKYNNLETTRQLINNKAHLKDGFDSLRIAVEKEHKDMLEFLLNYIDAEASDIDGTTAIHIAASITDRAILKLLLNKGVNVDAKRKNWETALHIASEKGHFNTVDILLQHGSDINNMTEKGETPLDLATKASKLYPTFGSYYRSDWSDEVLAPHNKIIKNLRCHMIKMKAADLYLNERNMSSFEQFERGDELENLQSTYKTEIVNMKSKQISNNISFYDILSAESSKLVMYSRNKTVVQAITTNEYETKFPLYANMIDLQLKRGMRRNNLMEQSDQVFCAISSSLPELILKCTEKIYSYLSNNDLKNLINACKSTNTCNPKKRKHHEAF